MAIPFYIDESTSTSLEVIRRQSRSRRWRRRSGRNSNYSIEELNQNMINTSQQPNYNYSANSGYSGTIISMLQQHGGQTGDQLQQQQLKILQIPPTSSSLSSPAAPVTTTEILLQLGSTCPPLLRTTITFDNAFAKYTVNFKFGQGHHADADTATTGYLSAQQQSQSTDDDKKHCQEIGSELRRIADSYERSSIGLSSSSSPLPNSSSFSSSGKESKLVVKHVLVAGLIGASAVAVAVAAGGLLYLRMKH